MRTRNLTNREDNASSSSLNTSSFAMLTPALSTASSSSGSPTRDSLTRGASSSHQATGSPSKLDSAAIHGTTSLLPSYRATPSPGVRRTLTYSPTKGVSKTTRRITIVLLGLIFLSVFLTMLCTILLLDDGKGSDAGVTFGAPPQVRLDTKTPVVEHPPRIRVDNGHVVKPPMTNLTKVVSNLDEEIDVFNDNIAPIVKGGSDQVVEMNNADDDQQDDDVDRSDDSINGGKDEGAMNDPQVNDKGLEDDLEELPDQRVNENHKVEEPGAGVVDSLTLNETGGSNNNEEPGAVSKPGDDKEHGHPVIPGDQVPVPNATAKSGTHPRIIFYEVAEPPPIRTHRELPDDPMLHAPPGFEAAPQDRMKPDYTQGDCVPMHDWQTKSFPNCNLVHEYDMKAAGPAIYKNNTNLVLEDNMALLGQGWFRQAWKLSAGASDEAVILKTLRLEREFYDEYYDLHRRDAVAMERLTHSPFIMDIYGYCGQSALNELAEFGDGMLASLEKVDRRMRGNEDPQSYLLKLQLGASVAVGVAHIHEIDDDDRPSMAHYDLNPRNVAIVGAGKPKINDFNIAEFLHWNPKKNETCGFPSRLHEPWWRSPEEVVLNPDNSTALTAAVDVYALGSILFHILTTHSPRGKMKKERAEEVREKVLRGEPPFLDVKYTKSKDPSIVAFREAMKLCFEPDPKKRGTSRQVADIMLTALLEQKKKRKAKLGRKGH